MKINFKQPRYKLPLAGIPFFCLCFYVYRSSSGNQKMITKQQDGINTSVGDVSTDVKKQKLTDKLDAYRNVYKQVDGYTAVGNIPQEKSAIAMFHNNYSDQQKKQLDSIDQAMKEKYALSPGRPADPGPGVTNLPGRNKERSFVSPEDKALASALSDLSARQKAPPPDRRNSSQVDEEKDPMGLFKQQMAYMDSLNKTNDPVYKAEKQKEAVLAKTLEQQAKEKILTVSKDDHVSSGFNTILPDNKENFIMAIIDENVTGYAGSRIRLRLLDNIRAGNILIEKGTYIYALINGFSGQRVMLNVQSIFYRNRVLPVKLDVYDMDGLAGLYVPESAFREFTRDLGTNTIQGITIDGGGASASAGSQLLMSSVDKIFQSTSSAIANAIRKNKAKIKYNAYIYLIDSQTLQNEQNTR